MNELLLIKPQTNHYYIKKNKAYTFNFLGIVNKQNQIIGLGLYPNQLFCKTEELTPKLQRIIGTSKLKKATNKDTWTILQYKEIWKINTTKTSKPVRGIRYATEEECQEFRLQLVIKLSEPYTITYKDILFNSREYGELYRKCSENGLLGELFKLENKGGIIQ